MIRAGIYNWNIILETDDPSVKTFLEFAYKELTYNIYLKHLTEEVVKGKIFNRTKKDRKTKHQYYELGIGWASYIINLFSNQLPAEDVAELKRAICQDSYRIYPFPELWDIQNSDVLHLLKYRYGLYTVYTGYGKTSVIACLANYFATECNKRVLLITPSTKARDELIKRIEKNYGIKVNTKKFGTSDNIQSIITQGFLNRKDYKDESQRELLNKTFETFDVILCDEVEYCINTAGEYIISSCTNVQYRYAFSGTADKNNGDMINFQNGINDPTVARNKDLIKFFGPSLIYRKPLNKEIDLINVQTSSLSKINLKDLRDEEGNIYLATMSKILTDPEVCKAIIKIAKTFPLLFIPINNLVNIINYWIEKCFIGNFRVLLVCGEGYIYYDLSGNKENLTLQQSCDYILQGKVDIIPSTASGFRALDLPGLRNILLISGNIAGSVLQQVGRVARQDHMNIISLVPSGRRRLPIYSKGCDVRDDMIKDYYKYCKITTVFIREDELYNYNGIK